MANVTSFYLSRVIGNKVYSEDKKVLGKLQDLIVDAKNIRPKVIAAKVKSGKNVQIVDFSFFIIYKEKGQYVIETRNLKPIDVQKEDTIMLVKHILDKQIVDMNGRKVVRVNDIRLAILSTGVYIIAVDIGLEGLLRRLGLAKPLKKVLKPLGKSIPSRLILWDDVEPLASPHSDLKLSTTYSKLSTLHPSDLADIIEELDKKTQAYVFSTLDEEKAADVLEELDVEAQRNVLESLPVEKAADLLEKMPADEVADILDEIKEERAEELLNEMEKEASEKVKELMDYPENTVGSIMTTDFIAFTTHFTVEQTIQELRRLKPDPDEIYYLYVIDNEERLCGVVSLRDLVISEPQTPLYEIMSRNVVYVKDMDNVNSLVEIISKYSLLAVPVVDDDKRLIGVVIINDIVYELLKVRKKLV
ncbi:magnesium transporter [Caldicellulosiruptor naganoensis]|uniref:CBS domain-containing protein n=1 Tax=Caldicellulosiruptor naganoensis TaxID=29324 RepID=A0ABY7BGV6_9FIRM|nr:CBS domain-containing protein [Caldicellulosiruptor naganoensis]WAM32063.1 CBS domain-containing protein [Caldicellulosiruptor naganoensis]